MTIPAAAQATPLPRTNAATAFVDDNGLLTRHATQFLSAIREMIVGMNRITPCSASGTDIITLTPNAGACPLIEKYVDYEVFIAAAAETSTGSVTATVVPRTGTLSTLKVYKTNGAAQAGAGDIVQNSVYMFIYADHLDAGAGGLVLK